MNQEEADFDREGGTLMEFEISASTMLGFIKALRTEGLYDAVYERSTPSGRKVLEQPLSAKWHRSSDCVELNRVLLSLGPEKLEHINYRTAKESLGGVLMPAAKVAMVFGGGSPASILSRLNHVLRVTNRGLSSEWQALEGNAGIFTLEYGSDCPDGMVEYGWRGLLRVASEVVGKTIRIDRFEAESARRFHFHVSW